MYYEKEYDKLCEWCRLENVRPTKTICSFSVHSVQYFINIMGLRLFNQNTVFTF